MNTRRNVLLYILFTCAGCAVGFYYGQWSLLSAQKAVERSMTFPKPAPANSSKYIEC